MGYNTNFMPDGSYILVDQELVYKLHMGDPTLGWEGDPSLILTFNGATEQIELWRDCPDGTPRLLIAGAPGKRVADLGLIKFLVTHDSQRGYDAVQAVIDKELKRKADEKARHADAIGESAERLHHALKKDIGAHEGGSTKTFMPLPEVPWSIDDAYRT